MNPSAHEGKSRDFTTLSPIAFILYILLVRPPAHLYHPAQTAHTPLHRRQFQKQSDDIRKVALMSRRLSGFNYRSNGQIARNGSNQFQNALPAWHLAPKGLVHLASSSYAAPTDF